MLKIENTEVIGWGVAIRGIRNPMDSLEQSDSDYRPILCKRCDNCMSYQLEQWGDCEQCEVEKQAEAHVGYMVGPNDLELMTCLRNAGTDHRKFMQMVNVYADITAPLYWWSEFKAYCTGGEFGDNEPEIIDSWYLKHDTKKDSCSDAHDTKKFKLEDFSYDQLNMICGHQLESTIEFLNLYWRIYEDWDSLDANSQNAFRVSTKKEAWRQMIKLMPSSYNQKRTVMLSYEALTEMYKSCKNNELDEWQVFCEWIRSLPYSELITGEKE